MKRDFKKIGANVKSRKVFVWACYVRQIREYFSNLNIKNVSNNETYRGAMKPFFSDKVLNSNSSVLPEKRWNNY